MQDVFMKFYYASSLLYIIMHQRVTDVLFLIILSTLSFKEKVSKRDIYQETSQFYDKCW